MQKQLTNMHKKMCWGLVGGGRGSQIGEAHRIAARLDGFFELSASALDVDPASARAFALDLGISKDRAYGDWREMLSRESQRAPNDRLNLVTIATPNATHFEITKAFLEAGFNVLCEKPLTMTVEEADQLCTIVDQSRSICAVNFGYSGYPMAIQVREMIRRGDLGQIRVVVAEFAHGAHANAEDRDNPRVRWRYNPAEAGVSSVVADLGIHALHMAEFMTGHSIIQISAHFDHCVEGRQLEDDALLAYRFDGGAVGRLWASAIACGQPHGFSMRVFGSKGGIRWHQEQPNQLYWSPLAGSTQILERGGARLYPAATNASRIAIGHAEGMFSAFANIYRAIYTALNSDGVHRNITEAPGYPDVRRGAAMVRAVHAAAKSASMNAAWIDLRTMDPRSDDGVRAAWS
ncbi:MAG TPA: Gfo/Idh/MocA family oxidoreductase [Chthoniobacterales bacterium]